MPIVQRADAQDIHDDYVIDIYYRYIHPAHPFVLPRQLYRQNRNHFPHHLRTAMCFIAGHHSPEGPEKYREACRQILSPGITEDGFKVQSLILYTLASYARFERDEGQRALSAAADVALRIGLNSDLFGHGQEPIFQESWRRTWWELYTITGLISLISGINCRLSQPVQMMMPTHCEDYNTCISSHTKSTEEIQQRFSAESNFKWSSFAYRIEAMRILAHVLDISGDTTSSRSTAANAAISSYLLSIPLDKREGLNDDGDIDEIMSCALMIIHLASICLHLPRSTLARLRGFKTVCGNERGSIPVEETKSHRAAALRSAKSLSDLLSARPSLKTVSPCFSCAIAFAAVVQLGEYLMVPQGPKSDSLKEYIQLQLSALNSLGETWPIARVVRGQIAQFSREILTKAPRETIPDFFVSGEATMPDDQWLQDLLNDDIGIMPGYE